MFLTTNIFNVFTFLSFLPSNLKHMILVLLHKLNRSPTLHPLDTGHKLNVDKKFRRRPERPVSTGEEHYDW